jgi:hypothetical protein
VTNPLGGTYILSLAAAITKLGQPCAQGGAGFIFVSGTPESAVVRINAENEISFSISDAQGRSTMERQKGSNTVRLPNLPPFSRPVLAVLGMAFVLSGCSKSSAVYPLNTGSPSDVESCHDIVLCVTERLMAESGKDRLLMTQFTLDVKEFTQILDRARNLLINELHLDAKTMVDAWRREDLG